VHTPPRVDGPPRSPALAASLGRIALVRGVVVCALTAYVVFGSTISPALVARLVAVYWLIDGLVALWARRFAATLATSRALLLTRGIVAIVAAVVLLALPSARCSANGNQVRACSSCSPSRRLWP
jgi:uncharacterized membrane protein HdeD (DUF308 family)